MSPVRPLALAVLLLAPLHPQDPVPNPFVRAYLAQARNSFDAGQIEEALASVRRCLERDDRNLAALRLLAEIAETNGDSDTAVHTWHRWLEVYDTQASPPARRRERREVADHLAELDPEAEKWNELRDSFVDDLLDLGRQYRRREDWLGSLELYRSILRVVPNHEQALSGVAAVQRSGGQGVAVEDLFAGADPTEGLSAEQIAIQDARHADWSNAYTENTDNYRIKTNAGFVVLQTAAIAMEQVNQLYRRFFHYREDGGRTPKIEIRIFKNREEFREHGQDPEPWMGGHFIGSAVETYARGNSGEDSIRRMYRTLFHEAAHQFVSLTGPVPGWLNEAYASFFEGCVILSNGSVRWNRVPSGRLFPLARRMERGFMSSPDEARRDDSGNWITPRTAPPFRMVVENEYTWGPPWYAPTWGVVYFLYNYRDGNGRLVYREALSRYYESFNRGMPADPVAHFQETVLRSSPLSPVQSVDDLTPIWRDWILALRDREAGRTQEGEELLRFAQAALERGALDAALEFFQDARENRPDDHEILWQMAVLQEQLDKKPQATASYREFKHLLELGGGTADPRHEVAEERILELDPNQASFKAIVAKMEEDGLELARGYERRELPTMAMEIARRLSESLTTPTALSYYTELAEQTGLSLARWRIAYNEHDLEGWSQPSSAFAAYGGMIRSRIAGRGGAAMVTEQLACDVTFDGDFSLEAEMRIDAEGTGFQGRLMGLCFGRKSATDLHAVVLHPGGFLDISTQRGGTWTIADHRSAAVGSEWRKLRIDVTGNTLDVYLDGLYMRSMDFPNAASVRGGFGLIAGEGDALFRNVRLLARDRYDPAARIERRLAMERIAADSGLRQSGSFTGLTPPELEVRSWEQGEPVALEALRGKPAMLLFWSPKQDAQIRSTDYFNHLMSKGRSAGLETVVVCDSGTEPDALHAYLKDHPMPDARIAIDEFGASYAAYFVKAGYFGIPRVLLLDTGGKVVFEGDPGLRSDVLWKPGDDPTYVDEAFDRLIRR